MPLIERYIFRRTLHVFLLTLGALVATLWVTQVLRQLDVVTAKGQTISVFLLMTVFALPALVQVVAPIAFLVATIVTLNNFGNNGELPVMAAAGASRATISRPIVVLGVCIMLAVAFSHHILAPASLSVLRQLLTRVRADVIATLVQDGRFRTVEDGLTMHIREKAPDGSFRGIFVSDSRDPNESRQYNAAEGLLLERSGASFLVLQNGDLIREDHTTKETSIVAFETYALDLSQLGTPNAAPVYRAMERSTLFLVDPEGGDLYSENFPQRVLAEIHERTTAPLFTLAFGLIALAFLGRPHSNRQNRGAAVAVVVALCLALRTGGFAATAVGRNFSAAAPFMYAIPLMGIAFGVFAITRAQRMRAPVMLVGVWDEITRLAQAAAGRFLTPASVADGDLR